jgi:hypothetical protein
MRPPGHAQYRDTTQKYRVQPAEQGGRVIPRLVLAINVSQAVHEQGMAVARFRQYIQSRILVMPIYNDGTFWLERTRIPPA